MTPATRLRKRLRRGTLVAPGVFNAITGRLVNRCGFEAAYLSGAGLTNAMLGLPDVGLLTLAELVQEAGLITSVTQIPLIVDADTGFGRSSSISRTIRSLEKAGVAAIQIEDQLDPKRCGHLSGKQLIPAKKMAEKISSAVRARENPDLVIIARTDARAVEGFNGAVERAKRYQDAGADLIFPEALESASEFAQFSGQISAPLMANITEFGRSPYLSVKKLSELGYCLVIFPMTIFRVMMKAAELALVELKQKGTQRRLLRKMQTRKELYDLLDYQTYEKMESGLLALRPRIRTHRR